MPPAARILDMHTCPMSDGPKPHVGGPICMGATSVMIGFMPAARVGDMCVCVGPPDSIAKGSPTVQIEYMMAARMGDQTAHGGVITLGCPTVLIGESGSGGSGGGGGGGGAGGGGGGGGGGAGSSAPPPADPAPAEEAFQNASEAGKPLVSKGPCKACQNL